MRRRCGVLNYLQDAVRLSLLQLCHVSIPLQMGTRMSTWLRDRLRGNQTCGAPRITGRFATTVVKPTTCITSVLIGDWAFRDFPPTRADQSMVSAHARLSSTWLRNNRFRPLTDANHVRHLLAASPRLAVPARSLIFATGPQVHAHVRKTEDSDLRGWGRC